MKGTAACLLIVMSATAAVSTSADSAPCGLRSRIRLKRNVAPADAGSDNIGNPQNYSWTCTPEIGPSCAFRMPVTISVSDFWHHTKDISENKQRELIMEAAKKWELATKLLSFAWAPEGVQGDIDVKFAFIDGPRGAVGRAANPSPHTAVATWVRLDDAEKWVTHDHPDHAEGEYSVQWALLHELGHAIGLRHSSNREDIMYTELQKTKAILSAGDIIAAQGFYEDFSITSFPAPQITRTAPRITTAFPAIPHFVNPPSNPSSRRQIGEGWKGIDNGRVRTSGLIVDSLPGSSTRPPTQTSARNLLIPSQLPKGSGGQSAAISGIIISGSTETSSQSAPPAPLAPQERVGRLPNKRRKRTRKCSKRRQRNNQCVPDAIDSKSKQPTKSRQLKNSRESSKARQQKKSKQSTNSREPTKSGQLTGSKQQVKSNRQTKSKKRTNTNRSSPTSTTATQDSVTRQRKNTETAHLRASPLDHARNRANDVLRQLGGSLSL